MATTASKVAAVTPTKTKIKKKLHNQFVVVYLYLPDPGYAIIACTLASIGRTWPWPWPWPACLPKYVAVAFPNSHHQVQGKGCLRREKTCSKIRMCSSHMAVHTIRS